MEGNNEMTIPKFVSVRDKWNLCRYCRGTELVCQGLARDRNGIGCCPDCNHDPIEEEETNGPV